MPSLSADDALVWQQPRWIGGGIGGLRAVQAALLGFGYIWLTFYLIPLEQWQDLYHYVSQYSFNPFYEFVQPRTIIDYISGEYGWHFLIGMVFYQGTQFQTAFFVMSVVAASLTIYTILTKNRSPLLLVALLNPSMIDFFASQVRSALAYSFVFWAMCSGRFAVALVVILFASTVHTSMMLMLIPLFAHRALRVVNNPGKSGALRDHWGLAVMIVVALLLSSAQAYILNFLGDRRAVYGLAEYGAGFMFTLGWGLIGVAFYALSRQRNSLPIMATAFFFARFVIASLFGFYAHRYIPYAVPFACVALGGIETPRSHKVTLLAIYLVFSAIYFVYWTA